MRTPFLGEEQALGESVAHYVGSGLVAGEIVLVVATAAHRRRFRDRLIHVAFDLELAEATGIYSELDARDALAGFMRGGMPDAAKFNAVVAERIALLRRVRPGARVRAYSEMVDVLRQVENHAGALAVEELWHALCVQESVSLLSTEGEEEREKTRGEALFAGMLGHDLRNPLNAIVTTAHYLTRVSEEPKVQTAANRIVSSSNRMARMIEQLLDFTRIRAGNGVEIHRSHADLTTLCESIKGELETAHAGRQIVLSTRGDTSGDVDAERMQQVLSNVMANAVHHGSPGCVVRVDVDGTDPEALAIEVRNSGAVPPEIAPVLFEPFRATGSGPGSQGLGLGLYLTRQLVQAHGGTITMATAEPEGTTICVRMPRTAALQETAACLQH